MSFSSSTIIDNLLKNYENLGLENELLYFKIKSTERKILDELHTMDGFNKSSSSSSRSSSRSSRSKSVSGSKKKRKMKSKSLSLIVLLLMFCNVAKKRILMTTTLYKVLMKNMNIILEHINKSASKKPLIYSPARIEQLPSKSSSSRSSYRRSLKTPNSSSTSSNRMTKKKHSNGKMEGGMKIPLINAFISLFLLFKIESMARASDNLGLEQDVKFTVSNEEIKLQGKKDVHILNTGNITELRGFATLFDSDAKFNDQPVGVQSENVKDIFSKQYLAEQNKGWLSLNNKKGMADFNKFASDLADKLFNNKVLETHKRMEKTCDLLIGKAITDNDYNNLPRENFRQMKGAQLKSENELQNSLHEATLQLENKVEREVNELMPVQDFTISERISDTVSSVFYSTQGTQLENIAKVDNSQRKQLLDNKEERIMQLIQSEAPNVIEDTTHQHNVKLQQKINNNKNEARKNINTMTYFNNVCKLSFGELPSFTYDKETSSFKFEHYPHDREYLNALMKNILELAEETKIDATNDDQYKIQSMKEKATFLIKAFNDYDNGIKQILTQGHVGAISIEDYISKIDSFYNDIDEKIIKSMNDLPLTDVAQQDKIKEANEEKERTEVIAEEEKVLSDAEQIKWDTFHDKNEQIISNTGFTILNPISIFGKQTVSTASEIVNHGLLELTMPIIILCMLLLSSTTVYGMVRYGYVSSMFKSKRSPTRRNRSPSGNSTRRRSHSRDDRLVLRFSGDVVRAWKKNRNNN